MEIQIDRERRLLLLKWLKQGYIDSWEIGKLDNLKDLTREEIETELDRLAACMHDEECERLQRLGYCPYCKGEQSSTATGGSNNDY